MKQPTMIEQKYIDFLKAHPGATSTQIVKAWNIKTETVASRLSVMCSAGLLQRTKNLEGAGYRYWAMEDVADTPSIPPLPAHHAKKPEPPALPVQGGRLDEVVDQFVLTLAEELIRRIRPMVVEKLSASVEQMTKEIVRVVPVQKPVLKRILVCGLQDGYGKMLQKEFEGVAEIRYLSPEASFDRLKSNSAQVEYVVVAADFVGHKHIEAIQSTGVKPVIVHGGLTKLKDKLMELSV